MDPQLQKLLTAKEIFEMTRDCINDALNLPPAGDKEIMTLRLSIGEFKKLHGFYGSFLVMKHLTGAYIGRLMRLYAMREPSILEFVQDIFIATEEPENEACKKLMEYYTEKFGPVSAGRVQELDELATVWNVQDAVALENLVQGKGFDPEVCKGTAPSGMNSDIACAFISILRTPLHEKVEGANEAVLSACAILGRAPYTAEFEYTTRILGLTSPVLADEERSASGMNEGVVRAFMTLLSVPLATSNEEEHRKAKDLMFENCAILAASVYEAELHESLRQLIECVSKIKAGAA